MDRLLSVLTMLAMNQVGRAAIPESDPHPEAVFKRDIHASVKGAPTGLGGVRLAPDENGVTASLPGRGDRHYYGLDLMRFVAAWLVVFYHFGQFDWKYPSAHPPPNEVAFPFLHRMTAIGSVGVEIFFLISGFVIAGSAVGQTPSQFALRRAIRILPALWVCSTLSFIVRASTGEPISTLTVALLKSVILSPRGPYIDGVVWTLVVEAVFYALIFSCLLRREPIRFVKLAVWMGGLSAVFITIMFAADLLAPSTALAAKVLSVCDRFPFKVALLRHGVFFAAGILIWAQSSEGIGRRHIICLLALLVPCSLEISILREGLLNTMVSLALWWAALALLVASLAWPTTLGRATSPFVTALKGCGRFSYPLYLSHFTIGSVIVPAMFRLGVGELPAFAGALTTVVLLSYLVMQYPERMVQNRLNSILRSRGRTLTDSFLKVPAE
jgi:peptidoglycan/LPS O-acetylase OafA/YrhL